MSLEDYIGKKQVAEKLHISIRTVGMMMKRRVLPYYKFGRRVRFKSDDVQMALDKKCRIEAKRR